MASDMKSLLRQNSRLVSRSLVASDLLLLDLAGVDYFKDNIADIEQQTSADKKVAVLLKTLSKVPDNRSTAVFDEFLAALRRDGQEHVANIFTQQSDARTMSDEHYKLLMSRREEICKFLDPLNSVLGKLVSCDVFSDRDSRQIREQQGIDQMARETIDILSRKADCALDLFITALHNTGQEHVATILFPSMNIAPMSDEHRRLLISQNKEICKFLDPLNGVLDELVTFRVFTQSDSRQVRAQRGLDEMARETIDTLNRKADSAFDDFIIALLNTGQEHVATIIQPDIGVHPMSDEHRQLLMSKKAQLAKCFYVDPIVTSELSSSGIFSNADVERVNYKIDNYSRELAAYEIVDILVRKPDKFYHTFCQLLGQTDHEHVLCILTGVGKLPLSRIRAKVLAEIRDQLVKKIDLESSFRLTGILASDGSISDANKQLIEAQPTCERRCEVLLDIMACKSNSAYDTFLKALNDTGQQHIVTALDGVEVKVIVQLYFREDLPDDTRNKITDIVRQNLKKLRGFEPDIERALTDILEQNGLVLSDVRVGSILIIIRCYDIDSLNKLNKLIVDKTLDILFSEFCGEFAEHGLERLQLYITKEEFQKCAKQFQQMALMSTFHTEALDQAAEQFSDKMIVTQQLLDCLNLSDDQKDAILASSQMAKTLFRAVSRRPDVTFLQLIDVLRDFQQLEIAEYLVSYRSITWLSVKLLELVLMRTFIKLFTEHLESHYKTHEAIAAAYIALSAVCYNWWRAMIGWPQSNIRHWLRHRLHVQNSIQYAGVCRLKELVYRRQPTDNDDQFDVLPVDVCERLLMCCVCLFTRTLLPTECRVDITVFNTLSSVCQHFHQLLTARRYVKRKIRHSLTVICRPYRLRSSLLMTLTAHGERPVTGFTKLNNKLYVVYQRYDTINVYLAQQPFTQLRSIYISTIKTPNDMSACSINNCLYVAEYDSDCVWRVNAYSKVDKWLQVSNALSLSVTLEGQVVLLIGTHVQGNEDELTYLGRVEVYNAVGLKLSVIKLPNNIINPLIAIQSANKTFIIAHGDHCTEQQRVVEVNNEGKIIASFGGSPGSGLGQLNTPMYVAFDSEQRVLVADLNNDRVLLLNRQLDAQLRVLIKWDNNVGPVRIFYDNETLIVGVSDGTRSAVQIYSTKL